MKAGIDKKRKAEIKDRIAVIKAYLGIRLLNKEIFLDSSIDADLLRRELVDLRLELIGLP